MTSPLRHAESNAWLFAKHAAQLGLVASVAWFVVQGADRPAVTLAASCTSIVALVIVAMLDRQRFERVGIERAEPVVVDVVGPVPWAYAPAMAMNVPVAPAASWYAPQQQLPMVADVASTTGLAPLVHDMSVVLGAPVDVT